MQKVLDGSFLGALGARLSRGPARLLALGAALLWATPAVHAQPTFCEQDGLVVLEIETTPTAGSWVAETSISGYTGSSYYRWAGNDQFNSPGNGVLTYKIIINTPGVYNLRIRNYHDDPDPTEQNDCWTRLNGGTWVKTYSKENNIWSWSTRFEPHGQAHVDASYNLSAGTHTFEISGRSKNFRMDRVHFYMSGVSSPTDPGKPQSPASCVESGWTDLGNALAGATTPALAGAGPLTAGSATVLHVTNAPANAPGVFVLGLTELGEPFKSGVMVPEVDFLVFMQIQSNGNLHTTFPWFSGVPSGSDLYWQAWISDTSGPQGFSATNALRCTTP